MRSEDQVRAALARAEADFAYWDTVNTRNAESRNYMDWNLSAIWKSHYQAIVNTLQYVLAERRAIDQLEDVHA